MAATLQKCLSWTLRKVVNGKTIHPRNQAYYHHSSEDVLLRFNGAPVISSPSFLLRVTQWSSDEAFQISRYRTFVVCSKKMVSPKAVLRNLAKRRVSAAIRSVFPTCGKDGFDYLFSCYLKATETPFEELKAEVGQSIIEALNKLPTPRKTDSANSKQKLNTEQAKRFKIMLKQGLTTPDPIS